MHTDALYFASIVSCTHYSKIIDTFFYSSLYVYMHFFSICQVINTFTEAVQTVDMEKAVGKPHTIWVQFAKFYEDHEQVPEVRMCVHAAHTNIPCMQLKLYSYMHYNFEGVVSALVFGIIPICARCLMMCGVYMLGSCHL